jgi:hypothetical protein
MIEDYESVGAHVLSLIPDLRREGSSKAVLDRISTVSSESSIR